MGASPMDLIGNHWSCVMSVNVAIAGATGAVGQEFLTVLAERNFPIKNLKLLASSRGRHVHQSSGSDPQNGREASLTAAFDATSHDVQDGRAGHDQNRQRGDTEEAER